MHSMNDLHLPKKAPSHRQLRVGEELKRILSSELMRGDFFTSVPMGSVTVTHVSVSPDLRNATAFIAPLSGGVELGDALAGLGEIAYLLKKKISKEMRMKFTPNLRFESDDSFDQAQHIETLLQKVKQQESYKDH